MSKVLCPRHKEITPSVEVYETHGFCFGCHDKIPLEELGVTAPTKERYVENLEEKRRYVDTLPRKTIRGVTLPYDDRGYYICWSNAPYYKLRLWDPPDGVSKYKNPSGHSQPLFWARRLSLSTLYIVEGELNALSLAEVVVGDIVSPGSASEFMSIKTQASLTQFQPYATIVIVTDRDGPGTAGAIHMKASLLGKVPYVAIALMERDCNEVLCSDGAEALKEALGRSLSKGL